MRSAFADIAGKNVLRSLAANALHGVVHRLGGPADGRSDLTAGKTVQIKP